MFGHHNNNNNTIMNNIHTSSPTSWHPIHTSPSYELWELPTPSRSMMTEEEERSESEPRSSAHPQGSEQPFLFDFENQFLGPLLSSWSFSSPRNDPQQHPHHRPRLGSLSSVNSHLSVRTAVSQGERSLTKKQALGDATNTAPVLRLPRSRFL